MTLRPQRLSFQTIPNRIALATSMTLALLSLQGQASSQTYTTDADFDTGTLQNVNHDTPNNNQLQLNTVTSTFPVLWIANGGEDTVSKFDTITNKEMARYRTWFGPSGVAGHYSHLNNPWAGPAPSRTAVDINGNAYVANRHFEGKPALVMKILTDGGIDRNGNGLIDTSKDLNNSGWIGDTAGEILTMADTNGNGVLEPSEITDERIAWAVQVGPAGGLGRGLCIGTDGNLWVGLFNARQFYKISALDGSVLAGPVSVSWTPYGCLIDQNGTLWSTSLQDGILGRITNTGSNSGPWNVTALNSGARNYGIALGNGKVYLGVEYGGRYLQYDPATSIFSYPGQGTNFGSTGVGVDGAGKILSGPYNPGGVTKYNADGTVVWTTPSQWSSETRGIIPDQNNDIWQVSRTGNRLMKYRSSDGAPMGVFEVGNQPYTYSDASGSTLLSSTSPTGTWNLIKDGATAGMPWGTVDWTALLPSGASLAVQVRAADNQGDLPFQSYIPVSDNIPFTATGRFIQVEVRLTANQQGQTPILYDLTVSSVSQQKCDADLDGDIDKLDLAAISRARGQTPTASDPRDANNDGKIDPADVKICIPLCTRLNCATQ